MLRTARQLLVAIAATGVCTAGVIATSVTPAHAVPATAKILLKGAGSVYTENSVVNQGVVPGGTVKAFGVKILNTSAESQQFKVELSAFATNYTAALYEGSTLRKNTYFTKPVGPGATLSLIVKVTVPAGSPAGEYVGQVVVKDPYTGTALDTAYADANATYQTGTSRNDLFVKNGSQPYAGGSPGVSLYETANALKPGNTATFTVRLKNDATSSADAINISVGTSGCPSDYKLTVKIGTTDWTSDIVGGTFLTGVMNPGARIDFKVSVKQLQPTSCLGTYFAFTASGPDGDSIQAAHVVTAA